MRIPVFDNVPDTSTCRHRSGIMQHGKHWFVSRIAILATALSACPVALTDEAPMADEVPMTRQIKSIVDFQCHGAKSVKQAEANYANMARDYTDQHPVMVCLKKKIEELKAAGK
jgi:hypothetical protein